MRKFVLFVMAFVFIVGAYCNTPLQAEETSYRSEAVMYTFTGPHDKITELFDVAPYWMLKYRNTSSKHFAIWINNEEGEHVELAANCSKPEIGIEAMEKGGRYYLEVISKGNWDVKIIEKELEGGKPTMTHYEYLKEPWEGGYVGPHDH